MMVINNRNRLVKKTLPTMKWLSSEIGQWNQNTEGGAMLFLNYWPEKGDWSIGTLEESGSVSGSCWIPGVFNGKVERCNTYDKARSIMTELREKLRVL